MSLRVSLVTCALLVCAARASAQGLALEEVLTGLHRPAFVGQAPGDSSRLFILERRRGLRILREGQLQATPFLDISDELTNNEAATGFAFHPDYATNGRFFVVYLDDQLFSHVAEYRVSVDPDLADPASRIQILGPLPQPSLIHNLNCLEFGPDGMLYVASGDGLFVADGGINHAQDLSNPFGKILRLDVDAPYPHAASGNPFVGVPLADERIWVLGARNPWRMSFDALNGDLYIADVGWTDWEELNVLNAGRAAGVNLGWRCYDGDVYADNFGLGGCLPADDSAYHPPAWVYPHADLGCAVIGGQVYRGSAIASLQGAYLYGDYCSGRIWSFRWDGQRATQPLEHTAELVPPSGGALNLLVSFGRDLAGELYLMRDSGELYKIVAFTPPKPCGVEAYCQSTTNSAGSTASISALGSMQLSRADFSLAVDGVLPDKVGLFFYGSSQLQEPFGGGFLCAGPNISRLLPASLADGSGHNEQQLDFDDPPSPQAQIFPGTTWHFQYWYRDAQAAELFNLSDGLSATFCP